ncbi:MAG: hypothetical protein ACREID_07055 [Planctomycetota bacterium]
MRRVLLSLLLPLVGCAAAAAVRAQDYFNEAVRAEERQRAERVDGSLSDHTAAIAGYRRALQSAETALRERPDELERDGLLGNTYVIKALCLWRLQDLESDSDARSGKDALGETLREVGALVAAKRVALGTRDRVLLEALPGLRDHDRALRAWTLGEAEAGFDSAFKVLEESLARVQPPPNHPIRLYVRLAQLRALRAWKAAAYEFLGSAEEADRYVEGKQILARFRQVLERLKPEARVDGKLRDELAAVALAMGVTWQL